MRKIREVKKIHIENDIVNNKPTLVFTDETGKEWALTHRSICYEGGGTAEISPKESNWYFQKKNKPKC